VAVASVINLMGRKPRHRKGAADKAGFASPKMFGDMQGELSNFLDRIRDVRRMEERQLNLPGFEDLFNKG